MKRFDALFWSLRFVLVGVPLALMAIVALALAWGQSLVGGLVSAGPPGIDLSMIIEGGEGKGPDAPSVLSPPPGCTTKLSSANNCAFPVGAFFNVTVHINSIAGLPNNDLDAKSGYVAIQVSINHDPALAVTKNAPGVTELGLTGDPPHWPDCVTRSEDKTPKGDGTPNYLAFCDIDISLDQESLYTGLVLRKKFICTQGGKFEIVLKHGPGDSLLLDDGFGIVVDPAGDESLFVWCQPPKNPSLDTDGDGCEDIKEQLQPQFANIGGGRDPQNHWDFYDVWGQTGTGGAWEQDELVDLFNDVVGVISRFGKTRVGFPVISPTKMEASTEAAVAPVDTTSYHAAFDRGPPGTAAPDGIIDLFNDIVGVITQFGHDCR